MRCMVKYGRAEKTGAEKDVYFVKHEKKSGGISFSDVGFFVLLYFFGVESRVHKKTH